jgi:hypothetical protein
MTNDNADDALLGQLQDLLHRADPIPPNVVAAAKASLTWRTIDAELAELSFDSLEQDRDLVGVRSTDLARILVFQAESLRIEVQVTEDGDQFRLVGQVDQPGERQISIRHGGALVVVTTDGRGRFRVTAAFEGPISLQVERPGQPPVETSWTTL